MNKISIIGAGNVGATAAHWIAAKNLGEVVLVDIVEGIPQGKALDLLESGPIQKFSYKIKGTNSYEDIKDSDIVVIAAGLARKPGMSRDELLEKNTAIVKDISKNIAKFSPNAIIIVVSNPLDAMVYVAKEVSGFPKERVIGMAGILDSARFKTFIAEEAGVSSKDVNAFVLGGHGDTMIPLKSNANISGIPLGYFLDDLKIDELIKRTRDGGAEIVNLLKTGSAYYAPSAAVCEMVEAILCDEKRILPCAAYLDGEFGVHGIFIGVPIKLGRNGVEKIIEIELRDEERVAFDKTVESVQELVEKTKKFLRL